MLYYLFAAAQLLASIALLYVPKRATPVSRLLRIRKRRER